MNFINLLRYYVMFNCYAGVTFDLFIYKAGLKYAEYPEEIKEYSGLILCFMMISVIQHLKIPLNSDKMRFFIKYMVCDRCKALVMNAMDFIDIAYITVNLGELITGQKITSGQFNQLKASLKKSGLELLDRPDSERLENLINSIDELIDFPEKGSEKNCGDYINIEFNQNFNSLNILFSETKCISIGKYIDERKIMKIKELLSYNEVSLAEIVKIMKYSSIAQLSGKFKSITGLTPLDFRQIRARVNYCPGCN